MNINTKLLLESEGFQVIEGNWDFTFKTRTFVRHPDGRLNPYYDSLHEIPFLPNGTEIDLGKNAMPNDDVTGNPTGIKNAGAINNVQFDRSAPIPPPVILMIGRIIISLVLLAILICIYYLLRPPAQKPPCGTEASIVEVGDCLKIITLPNCDTRSYDSCNNEWAEPNWHGWEPPADWMTYVIVGVVAIGALIIVPPLIRNMTRRKYQPYPEPYAQPSGGLI